VEPLRGDAIVGERGMNAVQAYRRSALCARSCTSLTGSTDYERYPRHRGRRVSHSAKRELDTVCARSPNSRKNCLSAGAATRAKKSWSCAEARARDNKVGMRLRDRM